MVYISLATISLEKKEKNRERTKEEKDKQGTNMDNEKYIISQTNRRRQR